MECHIIHVEDIEVLSYRAREVGVPSSAHHCVRSEKLSSLVIK